MLNGIRENHRPPFLICNFAAKPAFKKFRVADKRVSYVTSLTGYRRMSAVCVQPSKLHVHMAAASHNSLTKMVKYSLLLNQ